MPFEAVRFVHASQLFLDHQLRETGPLPDEIREIVEDATLRAFERVISVCIQEQVDFLLLTGNSFVEQDRSLRARVALQRGFDRLGDREIRVFVLPGPADPPHAWQSVGNLPDNVTPFFSQTGEAVAVIRDGKVIASVTSGVGMPEADNETETASRCTSARRIPFSIGVLVIEGSRGSATQEPGDCLARQTETVDDICGERELPTSLCQCQVDYLALGGSDARHAAATKVGIAHNPGGTQGISPRDTGPHGCTLVDVDPEGTIQSTFIPTAPVRRESFTTTIDAQTTRDELAETMRTALEQCRPPSTEKAFLVRWTIHGSGPLAESLHDEEFRTQLADRIGQGGVGEHRLLLSHQFRLLPGGDATGAAIGDNRLASEYFDMLEGERPFFRELLEQCLEQAALPGAGWPNRWHSLLGELDHEVIAGRARRLGMTWFAAITQEGSSS